MKRNPNLLLRLAREQRGWSQEDLARQLDTNKFTVNRWERGVTFPHPYHRQRLSHLFDLSLAELGLQPAEESAREPEPETIMGAAPALPLSALTQFVGRADLLATIRAALTGSDIAAGVVLHGLPGVGKTALALQVAYDRELRQRFAGGVLWAGLGSTPNVMATLALWAQALGLPAQEIAQNKSLASLGMAIRTHIGARAFLLVIDDAWTVADALALRVGGDQCVYLITTRFPGVAVQLAPNRVFPVPELDSDTGLSLLESLAPAAVAQEPQQARALVQSVGGLPLALTILGHYLFSASFSGQPRRIQRAMAQLQQAEKRLMVEEIAAPLEHPLGLPLDIPISLSRIIAMSVQHLPDAVRQTLTSLALFPAKPNSFSEEAAIAFAPDAADTIIDHIDRLLDSGVIETHSPGRYMLHQTIVDYAQSQASMRDVTPFLRYFSVYVRNHRASSHMLDQELHNICALLDQAQAEPAAAIPYAEVVLGVTEHFLLRGMDQQAEEYLQGALQRIRDAQAPHLLVDIFIHLGRVCEQHGSLAQALTYTQEAQALTLTARQRCHLLNLLGRIAYLQGDMRQTDTYLQEALILARQGEDNEQMCIVLGSLVSLKRSANAMEEAEAYCLEGLTLAQVLKNDQLICEYYFALSSIHGSNGNYEQAYLSAQHGLDVARRISYQTLIDRLLSLQALAAKNLGDFAQAETLLREALDHARQLQQPPLISGLCIYLGDALAMLAREQEAEDCLHEAIAIARDKGYQERLCHGLSVIVSHIFIKQGRFAEAQTALQECWELAVKIPLPFFIANILLIWGDLYIAQANIAQAAAIFEEALVKAPNQELKADALFGLAQVAAAQSQPARARQLAQQSYQLYQEIKHIKAQTVSEWSFTHTGADMASVRAVNAE